MCTITFPVYATSGHPCIALAVDVAIAIVVGVKFHFLLNHCTQQISVTIKTCFGYNSFDDSRQKIIKQYILK